MLKYIKMFSTILTEYSYLVRLGNENLSETQIKLLEDKFKKLSRTLGRNRRRNLKK